MRLFQHYPKPSSQVYNFLCYLAVCHRLLNISVSFATIFSINFPHIFAAELFDNYLAVIEMQANKPSLVTEWRVSSVPLLHMELAEKNDARDAAKSTNSHRITDRS